MIKNFKGRLALLAVAAALTVCGCSAGSPAETEGTDNASLAEDPANEANPDPDVQIYENFIEAGEAMGLNLWDFGVDARVYRSDYEGCEVIQAALGATYEENGTVGTASPVSSGSGIPFAQNLPVIIFDKEPNGALEGGLVETTVIRDPDDSIQNMPGIVTPSIRPIMQTVVFSSDEDARAAVAKELSGDEKADHTSYRSSRLSAEVTVYYGSVAEAQNIISYSSFAVFEKGGCTYILAFGYDPETTLADFTAQVKNFTESYAVD